MGNGIQAIPNSVYTGTSVRNGSVVGMGRFGVQVGFNSELADLRVHWNRSGGIDAHQGTRILNNAVRENGGIGIVGIQAVVQRNTSQDNAGSGILVSGGSVVSGNSVVGNAGDGIDAFGGDLVEGNTAYSNTFYGLSLAGDVGYRGNVVTATGRAP